MQFQDIILLSIPSDMKTHRPACRTGITLACQTIPPRRYRQITGDETGRDCQVFKVQDGIPDFSRISRGKFRT
jgi:hypothetical protein